MRYFCVTISFVFLFSACDQETERLQNYEVHGIDVSHYQSYINWDTVATERIHFVFMKATEGLSFKDTLFLHNWKEVNRVELKRGAYHFFHPTLNAKEQALNFQSQVYMKAGDLPPVLDVEVTGGASKKEIISGMKAWLSMTELHYGIKPIIYTNLKFYYKYLAGHFEEYPIWIARYKNTNKPNLAAGKDWDFWQYGNRGQMAGIYGNVDFNVFKGNIYELNAMCLAPRTVLTAQ